MYLFLSIAANTDSKNDGTFKVPTGVDEATVETHDEMPQMPNLGGLGDMLKNVDIDSMMKNMDLGAMGNMMKGIYNIFDLIFCF